MALDMNDLHWAAGFLEGEGSFMCTVNSPGKAVVRISAPQVQIEPLERLERMFGGSLKRQPRNRRNPNWARCFCWQIDGYKAAGLMMTLWPLLSPRRRSQVETALEKWKGVPLSHRMRKRFANTCAHNHALTTDNVYWGKTAKGYAIRHCLKCRFERAAARRRKCHASKIGAAGPVQLVLDSWSPRAQGTWVPGRMRKVKTVV